MQNYYVGLDVHSRESVFVVGTMRERSLREGQAGNGEWAESICATAVVFRPHPASHTRPGHRIFRGVNSCGLSSSRS
jgi:hypothetical protein